MNKQHAFRINDILIYVYIYIYTCVFIYIYINFYIMLELSIVFVGSRFYQLAPFYLDSPVSGVHHYATGVSPRIVDPGSFEDIWNTGAWWEMESRKAYI